MACLFAILGIFFPRIVIIILALTTDYLSHAYHSVLWPILGFFVAPFTVLAYAFAINSRGSLGGWHLAIFILAILMDLGVIGGSRSKISKKKRSGKKD